MNTISEKNETTIDWSQALLPSNHPTVIRRLCKKLNHRSAGFYFDGKRYTQARLHKGALQIRMCDDAWRTVETAQYANGTGTYFGDGNGGTICASHTLCGY